MEIIKNVFTKTIQKVFGFWTVGDGLALKFESKIQKVYSLHGKLF